jgi:hypothetical protein
MDHTNANCYEQHLENLPYCDQCERKHPGNCSPLCSECDKRHKQGRCKAMKGKKAGALTNTWRRHEAHEEERGNILQMCQTGDYGQDQPPVFSNSSLAPATL